MAYHEFSNEGFKSRFGLAFEQDDNFYREAFPVAPSELLLASLRRNTPLAMAISTEKARSELIVAPMLVEVHAHFAGDVSLFSGNVFNVAPEQGLAGVCDFLLGLSRDQFVISVPVAAVVEAKKDDIAAALGQCAAAMLAARLFNERHGLRLPTIFGAVTSGTLWRFLALDGDAVRVGNQEHSISNELPTILGAFVHLLNQAKAQQAQTPAP